jgi:hypothetical protein
VVAAALIVVGASLTGSPTAAYGEQPQLPVVESTDRPLDADFNGDGRDELVVGVPLEDVGGAVDAGGVAVISLRTSPLRNQFFTRATAGIDGDPTAGDQFGYAVATTDFDGDGFDDLAIGAPYEDVAGIADAGAVHILYGSADGLVTEGSQHLTQNTDGIEDEAEAGDLVGWSLVAGQLGNLHDTLSDLAVGAPGEDVGEAEEAGAVHAVYGSADGLTAEGDELFTQDSPGILDIAQSGDHFGYALTLDLGGNTPLIVSAPDEDYVDAADAGVVHVIYRGIDDTLEPRAGAQMFSQGVDGIRDTKQPGDRFGLTLAPSADLVGSSANRIASSHPDLVIGVPFEDLPGAADAGMVQIIPGGGRFGFTPNGDAVLTQDSPGVREVAETGDRFGLAITTGLFGRFRDNGGSSRAQASLAIGVPFENLAAGRDAGMVQVIYKKDAYSLGFDDDDAFTQDSDLVFDQSEPGDLFGRTLAAADVAEFDAQDLIIGVPLEDLSSGADAGLVQVLRGEGNKLRRVNNIGITQNSVGVADQAEPGDQFGRAVGNALGGG